MLLVAIRNQFSIRSAQRCIISLTEEENLQQGSREYKIARKLVSRKIDRLGPENALLQVVDRRYQLMEQIKILKSLEDSGIKNPHLDF